MKKIIKIEIEVSFGSEFQREMLENLLINTMRAYREYSLSAHKKNKIEYKIQGLK